MAENETKPMPTGVETVSNSSPDDFSSTKFLTYLKNQEGFVPKPAPDPAGYPTVGYGHKLRPGEDYSKGISEAEATRLLIKDVKEHYVRVKKAIGDKAFARLSDRDKAKLLDIDFNVGLQKFPKFTAAVLAGDEETQIKEHRRFFTDKSGKKVPLERRNSAFLALLFGRKKESPNL